MIIKKNGDVKFPWCILVYFLSHLTIWIHSLFLLESIFDYFGVTLLLLLMVTLGYYQIYIR